MGFNKTIKAFDPRMTGTTLDLFSDRDARLPVVLELLKSPWIMSGRDLSGANDTRGLHLGSMIEVSWNAARRAPCSFVYSDRRYNVDAIVQTWAIEQRWWDREQRVSRRCFRVLARGGVYDLAYDRLGQRWLLADIID